jgi:hypothetical protein
MVQKIKLLNKAEIDPALAECRSTDRASLTSYRVHAAALPYFGYYC